MSDRTTVVRFAMSMLCEGLPDGALMALSHSRDAVGFQARDVRSLLADAATPPLAWSSEPPGEGEPTWQYCEENHGVLLVPKFDPAVRCPHCVFFPVIKPPEPEGGE